MVRVTDPRQENGGLDLEIFIQKRKGTLTVSGKEMANVIAVAESADTSHCLLSFLNTVQRRKREVTSLAYSGLFILQVMFSNLSAGVRLDLGKFDILANDFSMNNLWDTLFPVVSLLTDLNGFKKATKHWMKGHHFRFLQWLQTWFLKGDRKIVLTRQVLTLAKGNLAWRPMKGPEIRREQRQMTTKEMEQMGRLLKK